MAIYTINLNIVILFSFSCSPFGINNYALIVIILALPAIWDTSLITFSVKKIFYFDIRVLMRNW